MKRLIITIILMVALGIDGAAQLHPKDFPALPDSTLLAGYPGYSLAVISPAGVQIIFNDGTDSVATYGASLSRDGLMVATGLPSRTNSNSRYPAAVATYSFAIHKWRTLTAPIAELRAVAISPDGTKVAYAEVPRLTASAVQLHVIDASSGAEIGSKEIGYTFLSNISWAADGRYLTYDTYEKPPANIAVLPTLFVFEIATSRVLRIGSGRQPAWSPSGDEIAYLDGRNKVAAVKPDGSNRRVLLSGKHRFEFAPVWSSDSKKLIVNELTNEDKFTFDLHLINLVTDQRKDFKRGSTPVFAWVGAN